MLEIILVFAAIAIVGQFLVSQKSFAVFSKERGFRVTVAVLIACIIVGWLGIRFLYIPGYWWSAWTFAMVLKMGIFNTAQFASYYAILNYIGIPDLLVSIVTWYIWVFFGVFEYSVMPFFVFAIFTSIPYAVFALIVLAHRAGEEASFWGNIPLWSGAAIVGFIQFLAVIYLLAANMWAQAHIMTTFLMWGYTDLLIVIFLPLALTVVLPVAITFQAGRLCG